MNIGMEYFKLIQTYPVEKKKRLSHIHTAKQREYRMEKTRSVEYFIYNRSAGGYNKVSIIYVPGGNLSVPMTTTSRPACFARYNAASAILNSSSVREPWTG